MKAFKLLRKHLQNNGYLLLHLKGVLVLNKGSDVLASIHDITNNVLSSSSNYIVDVVKGLDFGYFSTFMREVIITQILYGFDQKNHFFQWVILVKIL